MTVGEEIISEWFFFSLSLSVFSHDTVFCFSGSRNFKVECDFGQFDVVYKNPWWYSCYIMLLASKE